MSYTNTFECLLRIGQNSNYPAVAAVEGAGNPECVIRFSDSLRGTFLADIARLSSSDIAAFVKAVAAYEDTVGGLGSVTALQRLLPLIQDNDHAILDWILSNTKSYRYYSYDARSYAELMVIKEAHAARRARNEQREREREAIAKSCRAKKASANLFNAIRRGDTKAVEALLRQGANPDGFAPDGASLIQYAERCRRTDISALLHSAPRDENSV